MLSDYAIICKGRDESMLTYEGCAIAVCEIMSHKRLCANTAILIP